MSEDKLVEAMAAALRQHIRVDATGLAPSVAGAFLIGFDEAARAALAALRETVKADAAVAELRKLQALGDTEIAHSKADDVLCDLLVALGFKDVVDEYAKVNKWFA